MMIMICDNINIMWLLVIALMREQAGTDIYQAKIDSS